MKNAIYLICLLIGLLTACQENNDQVKMPNGFYLTTHQGNELKGPSGQQFNVEKAPIVGFSDFTAMTCESANLESPFIKATFSSAGLQKMTKATENNLRQRLVFVFNGQILSATVIQEKITTKFLNIALKNTKTCNEIVKSYDQSK